MKNVPSNLINLKTKADKLDVNKLVPGSVDLLTRFYIMLRSKILKIK